MIIRLLVRLALAAAIAVFGYWYFSSVLPPAAAMAVAWTLAIVELVGPAFAGAKAGAGVRFIVRCGAALIAWPGIAWACEAGGMPRPTAMAVSAAAACALGLAASARGAGQDRARIVAILVAVALPVYAAITCAGTASPVAWAAAAGGMTVAVIVAREAGVWPPRIERHLAELAGVSAAAAGVSLVMWVL